MRVLVTGGSGFLGGHTVAAVRDEGHDVRVLARRPDRAAATLADLGVRHDQVEVVAGDVLDRETVGRALDGVEAVLHAANLFKLDVRDAEEVRRTNTLGTRTVLEAAAARGIGPIVLVSSVLALPPAPVVSTATPIGSPPGAYARSKADGEHIAQELRAAGADVVVTNPGGLHGPHDPNLGENALIVRDALSGRFPFSVAGGFAFADVRDVALAHARIIGRSDHPPRYPLVGRWIRYADLLAALRRVTGRRLPVAPVPARFLGGTGRVADALQRRGVDPGFSSESIWILGQRFVVDDEVVRRELGIDWRPVEETLRDEVAWLHAAGHISRRAAGRAAGAAAA